MSYEPLGNHCHWCGERFYPKRHPSNGNHLFCCDAHKMAHVRAFAKWLKRCVTCQDDTSAALGELPNVKGNAKPAKPCGTSSPAISDHGSASGNVKGRRK